MASPGTLEEVCKGGLMALRDSTADKFLDVESIIFLVEGLVYNIEAALSRRT
jgi:hypothetical protein